MEAEGEICQELLASGEMESFDCINGGPVTNSGGRKKYPFILPTAIASYSQSNSPFVSVRGGETVRRHDELQTDYLV